MKHMKLQLLQENLNSALNQVQRVVPSKPQLPILSSILLTAQKNKVNLAATDLYVGMKTEAAAKVETPTTIAVPGKIFYNTVAALAPGKLELSLDKDTLTISSRNNTTTIQCMAGDEFPDFPPINAQSYSFNTSSIERIQDMVSFSASIDPTRPVLTALLFQFDQEGLLVVGTDGFRLATLKLSEEKNEKEAQFLIPAKAMGEVAKISSAQDQEVVEFKVSEELKQAVFKIGTTQLYVRLIEGEYPPFRKIIPTSFETEVEIDGEEFENQLKRAQVFARESLNIIRFQLNKVKLKIIASSPIYGRQEGVMGIDFIKGQQGEIAFNSRYLLDFISALKPKKIKFFMNESLTPAMMRPDGNEDYRYVIMPFRVNE